MGKYRKRPVVIEAHQYTGTLDDVPKWLMDATLDGRVLDGFLNNRGQRPWTTLLINTLEGGMIAVSGDWIIQGVKGEIYPCRDDIFKMTYEVVIDAQTGETDA